MQYFTLHPISVHDIEYICESKNNFNESEQPIVKLSPSIPKSEISDMAQNLKLYIYISINVKISKLELRFSK